MQSKIINDAALESESKRATVAPNNYLAALAEVASPYIIGVFDAEKGAPFAPEAYFAWDGDLMEYTEGFLEVKPDNPIARHFLERNSEYTCEVEEWRIIPGYPNYRVSNLGEVQSNFVPRTRGKAGEEWRTLKPYKDDRGYPQVVVTHNKKPKSAFVHALVLIAFVGPKPQGYAACHNNGVRDDNRLSNLRWDTYKNNEQDKWLHGTYQQGDNGTSAILTERDVIEIWELLRSKTMLQKDIAAKYGVSVQAITCLKKGRNWKYVTRQLRPLTDAEIAAETEALVDGRDDEDFWRMGQW